MEINISEFFRAACPRDYSASIAEIGNGAAAATWRAANEDAADYNMIDTPEKRAAFIDHMSQSGFSEGNEMEGWTANAINALFIQLISGDIREAEMYGVKPGRGCKWRAYEQASSEGACGGNMCRGTRRGTVFYYLGS